MTPLPPTPEVLAVAERVVWFKSPVEAFSDPIHFLAHVMTYGTVEDLRALEGIVSSQDFREALETRRRHLRSAFLGLLELEVRSNAQAAASR